MVLEQLLRTLSSATGQLTDIIKPLGVGIVQISVKLKQILKENEFFIYITTTLGVGLHHFDLQFLVTVLLICKKIKEQESVIMKPSSDL